MASTSKASNRQPDLMEVVRWLQGLDDPVERVRKSTMLIDQARDHLLPELAAVRRTATVAARQVLTDEGMSAFEANQTLAEQVGMSPATVMRLLAERRQYGG